jgi:peroxisomal enoyl-CoA hydratase 2
MAEKEDLVPIEAVAVGEVDERTVTDLNRRDFVRYAGASGDFNPIHYDEPYATDAGNPSVFAQGMLTAGIASTVVTDRFGVGAVRSFGTRFQARVFPSDTVTARTEVAAISADDDGPMATLDIEVVTRDGDLVITGEAIVALATDG